MKDVLQLSDNLFGDVLTPGRTDKKISRDDPHEPNDKYAPQLRGYLKLAIHGSSV